LKKHKTQKTS